MEPRKLENTEIYNLNEAYWKVQLWFYSFPQRDIGLNELSDTLKISKTTAKRIVEQLIKEGFLKRDILGKVWRISCDINHRYNFSRKVCFNLQMILESDIVSKINEYCPNPRSIVLFGSYRWGDDNEKSDIDIAVEISGNDSLKILEMGSFPKFGFRRDVSVNLHVFSRKKVDLNLFANIANGIVLDGFLEVRP